MIPDAVLLRMVKLSIVHKVKFVMQRVEWESKILAVLSQLVAATKNTTKPPTHAPTAKKAISLTTMP